MKKHELIVPVVCLALSACGGTTSGPPSGATYDPIGNILSGGGAGTAEGTVDLIGASLRTNGTSGKVDMVTVSGEIDFDTGRVSIDDGTYALIDADGGDSSGVITDGKATIATKGALGLTGSYDFVFAIENNYTSGSTSYDSSGFVGIETQIEDMPGSGTASFKGEAVAVLTQGSSGANFTDGASEFTADFKGKTVDVVMDGFTVSDLTTGLSASAPVDRIEITGMAISGNRFSDGTLKTTLGGSNVNLTGTVSTTSSEGAFFGYDDETSAPDEIGVSVISTGADGILAATAVAD